MIKFIFLRTMCIVCMASDSTQSRDNEAYSNSGLELAKHLNRTVIS